MTLIDRVYNLFQGKSICTYLANDLSEITPDAHPDCAVGSMIIVIATKDIFIKNGDGKWQKFGTTEVISGGDEYDHDAPELHPKGVIPEGAFYGIAETKEILEAGAEFPEAIGAGDIYMYGDYIYDYIPDYQGWQVILATEDQLPLPGVTYTTREETSYGAILESINGMPVVDMNCTFMSCTSLTTAPVIPEGVTDIGATFDSCTSLTSAPVIPEGVTSMGATFYDCTSLTTSPVIPASVTDMEQTFYGCTNLSGTITINATPTSYDEFLKDTQITEILGDCPDDIKAAILATR